MLGVISNIYKKVREKMVFGYLAGCLAIFYYFWLTKELSLAQKVAIAVVLTSFFLWLWSRMALGDSFTVKAVAHNLVINGPYRFLSHPIYVASVGVLGGLALFFKSPMIAVFTLVLIIIQYYRSKKEKEVLHEKFGKRYSNYLKTVLF